MKSKAVEMMIMMMTMIRLRNATKNASNLGMSLCHQTWDGVKMGMTSGRPCITFKWAFGA